MVFSISAREFPSERSFNISFPEELTENDSPELGSKRNPYSLTAMLSFIFIATDF